MANETYQDVVNDRNYHRRAHKSLTKGLPKLEWAAEVCGRMNWANAEEAIRHARHAVLGEFYDGLPLCEIEQAMAVKKNNTLVMLVAYEVVAPVIRRQLEAARRTASSA